MAENSNKSPSRPMSRAVSAADLHAGQGAKPVSRAASRADVTQALEAVTDGERDNHKLITKVKDRLHKVGLSMPGIEVRWENLLVELQPPPRPVTNTLHKVASALSSPLDAKKSPSPPSTPPPSAQQQQPHAKKPHRPVILDAGSGVLAPGRMCLLLGPPGAGRTTFLKALAGQLVPPTARRGAASLTCTPRSDSAGAVDDQPAGAKKAGRKVLPVVVTSGQLRVHGTVSYNGQPADGSCFEVARAATYIGQTENHFAELTVEETLTFAAECQGQGAAKRLHDLLSEREAAAGVAPEDPDLALLMALSRGPMGASAVVQNIARMLEIDHVMDTVVGNEMLKGISGGQKRRVTCGEMAVGMAAVMMADEITNGLDAASALSIIKSLRNLCEHANSTILATLLQPSPEVVACFHDVMIISGGRLLFHGPTDQLLPYFGSMGLAPFPRQSLADFAQEVTASPEDQARYRVAAAGMAAGGGKAPLITVDGGAGGPAPPGPGGAPPAPLWAGRKWVSPKRMRKVFDASEAGHAAAARLVAPPYTHSLQDLILRREVYGTSTGRMWATVLRREVTLFRRNIPFFIAGVVQIVFTAFLVSTGFVNLSHSSSDDANLFMSVIFYSLMTLFTCGFNFAPVYCQRLPVFYKQRDHRFYSPAAYAVSAVVMRLPDVVVQALSYSVMVYFSVGFTVDAGRFFLFLLNMLVAGFNSATTFTLTASVMRNESATQGVGAVFLMVSVLCSGFPIAPGSIPGWWIWYYWLTPMSWGLRSMLVSELTTSEWAPADDGSGDTIGVAALKLRSIPHEWKWVWAGIGWVVGISLLQVLAQVLALTYLGPVRPTRGGPEYEDDDDVDDPLARQSRSLQRSSGCNPPVAAVGHPLGNNSRNNYMSPYNGNGSATNGQLSANSREVAMTVQLAAGGKGVVTGGAGANEAGWALTASAPSPAPASAILPGGSITTATITPPPGNGSGRAVAAVEVNGAIGKSSSGGGGGSSSDATTAAAATCNGNGRALQHNSSSAAAAAAAGAAGGGGAGEDGDRVLAFRPVIMAFRDVSYYVRPSGDKKELQLLDRVSGVFRPGVLTSLMGASGAGKTTLMDVLAGRKTGGRVEGVQLVNGAPKRMSAFARLMGYVEQLDVHNPQATIEEALIFSARLRVGSDLLPVSAVRPFVRHMMEVVELGPLAARVIGAPGAGLSTEARKRLTIAVELVANPSIVFMDEPTTGLDARAASLVMRAVRNTVGTGRTVVCTIHQPNRAIMDQFDELLLLKPGGRTIYFSLLGEQQTTLVTYFSSLPGVAVAEYLPHMNPANWMLDVTSPAAEAALGVDFADLWAASEPAKAANQLIEDNCRADVMELAAAAAAAGGDVEAGRGGRTGGPGADADGEAADGDGSGGAGSGSLTTRFAQPLSMQLLLLLRRGLISQWRNTPYNGMRFACTFVLSWVLGSLYWGRGDNTGTIVGLFDIMGVMYSGSLFVGMVNLMMVMPLVMSERAVFYREKVSGMYRPVVFAAAQGLSEMPFIFVQSILYVVIIYTTVHFQFMWAKALWFWLYMFLGLVLCTFMGVGVMNAMPILPAAIASCSGLILLWNLFCGFLIYRKDMKPWYLWAYYGNPFTYIIYGCVTTQMGDLWDQQITVGSETTSVAQYMQDNFSYDYNMRGWVVLLLIAFIAAFRGAAYLGITRFNFQNR